MKCTRCGAPLSEGELVCQNCGSAVKTVEDGGLPSGTVIAGKYKILEQIGAGGMGRVYRAVQSPLDSEVCIKTLHKAANTDPQFPVRFEREAVATSKLRHPNIVSVIDFGSHVDGTMYLVMEFIRGRSLADISGRGQVLSAERAVRILGQVCDALSTAHSTAVLHRDLKPSNIMIQDLRDRPDFVKVLDFGSAIILEGTEETQRLTQVGTVIGTPAYMAPEHILGRGLDARVDVYAVGILLYKLLVGAPPFRGNTQSVMAQHVTVKPELPSKKNPKAAITPEMDKVIMHALVKDPAHRYPRADALKDAMENALAGIGDEGFELDEGRESTPAIEVAAEDRSVVMVSIRGAYRLDTEITSRVTTAGHTFGAHVETEGETVNLIFGLIRTGSDVAADAARCAVEVASEKAGRPVKVGVHDAQASCQGRLGTPGFRFELFGEGRSLASILASQAPNGQVLISGPVARHIPPTYRLIPIQPPPHFDVPVFRIVDLEAITGDAGEQPFVGRISEQRHLVEIAVDAAKGKICTLVGEEGIGKSRLVHAVTSQASKLGTLWLVVHPSSRDELGPDHPASVLTALGWSVSGGLGTAAERHGVDLMMGRTTVSQDTLRGERRQMRTVSAAMVGLSQRLQYSPVVVVLDNLHYADDMTWALARRLVDAAQVLGFAVVLNVRSVDEIPFSLPEGTEEIKLKPLTPKEMASLVINGLEPGVDETLAVKVASTVQGFPLLGEELIRALNEDRLVGVNEFRRLDAGALLGQLIASRIEGLSLPGRRILRAAAVLGHEPRQSELQGFGDAFQDLGGLMELESTKVLTRTARGGMRFPFPRMREVALASIPDRQLARLHRDAADIISRMDDGERRHQEIGEHLLRSGQPQQAFEVLREAAGVAQYEGHLRRAVRCLELAYEAGKELGSHHMRAQSEVARDRGELLLQLGATEEAECILREASFAARSLEDGSLAADLLRLHGRAILILGDIPQGRVELESTLTFAEQRGDVAVALKTCIDLVEAADKAGERAQTADFLRRGLELMDRLDPNELPTARIQLYNRLGRLELEQGNSARAIATFAQALDLTERYEDRYQEAGLLGNLGGAYARQKELDKALHFTERALRASEELGDFLGIARQSFNLALLKLSTGQTSASRELLRRSHVAAGRAGWAEGLAMSQAALDKLASAGASQPPPPSS